MENNNITFIEFGSQEGWIRGVGRNYWSRPMMLLRALANSSEIELVVLMQGRKDIRNEKSVTSAFCKSRLRRYDPWRYRNVFMMMMIIIIIIILIIIITIYHYSKF